MTAPKSIAALPMYDFVELRPATDALWSAIAIRLEKDGVAGVPATLRRLSAAEAIWTDPALLLAQTCGYPLVTSLDRQVVLLATPLYDAPGCDGVLYRSAVIVRADDPAGGLAELRGRRCAVNDAASNSGMNLLRAEIAPLAAARPPFFGAILRTGAHVASAEAVAAGAADVAAIDCVTWAHLRALRPEATAGLRVLAWTQASPGLPLITSRSTEPATRRALLRALDAVASDPALAAVRAALRLQGFKVLPLSAYAPVLELERQAAAASYPVLC